MIEIIRAAHSIILATELTFLYLHIMYLYSKIKTTLVAFFDSRELAHKEFVPTGQTVNANIYKHVLDRLIKRINLVRSDLFVSGDCFLQHNNKPAHNAASVYQFLAIKKVTVLHCPLYLPDLAPINYKFFLIFSQFLKTIFQFPQKFLHYFPSLIKNFSKLP